MAVALLSTTATGADVVEDFTPRSHFPLASGVLNASSTEAGLVPGDIEPGVTYSVIDPCDNGFPCFNIDAGGGYVGGFLDSLFNDGHMLTINFDNAQSAFGFDTNYLMPVFTVTGYNGTSRLFSNSLVAPSMDPVFFGFQSLGAGITSVTIDASASSRLTAFNFALDNFTFGAAASPPPCRSRRAGA